MRDIGFVAYAGLNSFDLAGPVEVFATATAMVEGAYRCRVLTPGGAAVRAESVLLIAADAPLEQAPALDTIVVPGGEGLREPGASGGWAFFGVSGGKPAQQIPAGACCYGCHQKSGAVDTTFTQFYPTMLPIAEEMGTLSPAYVAGEATLAAAHEATGDRANRMPLQ